MIGSLLLPTSLKSHHQGPGFHGSPVEPKARRWLRSCRSYSFVFASLRLCGRPSSDPELWSDSAGPLLTCGLLTLSSCAANARTKVGEIPRTSTLCFAQNSHMR